MVRSLPGPGVRTPAPARSKLRSALCACSLVLLSGPLVGQKAFTEVSEELGASFVHATTPITGNMGGGMAWLDVDGDRDDDLLLTSSDGQHVLLRWDLAQGRFADVSATSGLVQGSSTDTFGVAVADYDDDGLPDVYFTNVGPNQLYRNQGGAVFSDVTAQHPAIAGTAEMSTSASWADFDLDGDLDLYVGNYIQVFNYPFKEGWPNQLYVNEGSPAAPAFVDRAPELGVDDMGVFGPAPAGWVNPKVGQPVAGLTLSVATLDYDDDGDPDLMVGNDWGDYVQPNRVYRNDTARGGPLTFHDASVETGMTQVPMYNMGIHGADYDRDGDWDLYLSNLGDNALLRNDDGVFVDVCPEAGPVEGSNVLGNYLRTSWDTVWMDYDNDGWEDLFVANGYVPGVDVLLPNESQSPNSLWHNEGDGTFTQVLNSGMANKLCGRGAKFTDLDGDGGLEVFLENSGLIFLGEPPDVYWTYGASSKLYRTRPPQGRHWVQFRLAGTRSNSEALGARLEVLAAGRTQKRQVRSDAVYLTSPSRLQHVGLGAAARVDRLDVAWPSGTHQTLHRLAADARHHLVEPEVVVRSDPLATVEGETASLWTRVVNLSTDPRAYRVTLSVLDADALALTSQQATGSLAPGETDVVRVLVASSAVAAGSEVLASVETVSTGARDEALSDL